MMGGGSPDGWVYQPDAHHNTNSVKFEALVRVSQPRTTTIINDAGYALHLKRNVIPNTRIFIRHWGGDGDENDWRQFTPQSYFDTYGPQTDGGTVGLQIFNEPGFSPEVIASLNQFAEEGIRRALPVSLGGFSPSTPPDSVAGWGAHPEYERLAYLVSHHPEVVYDAHERYAICWTQGLVPKALRAAYNNLYFINYLLEKDSWPQSPDDLAALYMVGRVKALFDFCAMKWPGAAVQARIGEFGPDGIEDTSQNGNFQTWLKAQPSGISLVDFPRGYKAHQLVWQRLYPGRNWKQVNVEQGHTAIERIYERLGVMGVCWYIFGNAGEGQGPDKNWDDMNYANDDESQQIFTANQLPTQPQRKYEAGEYVSADVSFNIREAPLFTANKIGTLPNGARLTVLDIPPQADTKYNWIKVKVGEVSGWVADVIKLEKYTAPPPPPVSWLDKLPDDRMRQHVAWIRTYAGYGAPGHLDYETIKALAALLDKY